MSRNLVDIESVIQVLQIDAIESILNKVCVQICREYKKANMLLVFKIQPKYVDN